MQSVNTVLIIDDEPAARESLEALLTAEGYQLEFAMDGIQGLARAVVLYPDIILLDVMMPGIDGYEVCRRLREDPILAEVPVVMITALDDQASRLRGIEAGADDFISKPFDKSELRARVRAICRLNRYRLLLAEKVRFQWIIEQSQEGYIVLNQEGKIRYANPSAQLYLNLPGETSEQNFIDIVRQQFRCEPEASWQEWETQALPLTPNYLVRPETTSARAFWLQADELGLPESARMRRVVRLRNVTEAITKQCDMRRAETMLRHKLVTPVTNAYMSVGLLKKVLIQTPLPVNEMVQMVSQANNNLEHLVQEMKDIFQYIDAPLLAQIGQQVSLLQLDRMVSLLAKKLKLEKVAVTVPAPLQEKRLTITETALETILWEILENAKKFHPRQNPQLDVIVSTSLHDPQVVQLQVRDDGISLSPEQIKWAMLPYIQSEKYFTGEEHGMGLGLPLVSSLVWQAGGSARLFNRQDQPGVVVELVLPLTDG
jgi:DNA-binding response OmpR family regulator/anti-sigma regulatory factor (Ser/Thr protein kinase)